MSHYGHLFILVAALFSGSCALYEDCEKPPTVPHASVQTTDDDDSVYAVYTCADGYELSGIAELVCNLDTDEWNSDPPSCLSASEISNEVDPVRASEPPHKKKPQNVPENPRVSPQMAATLDMSCVQAKVKAPEIRYGFVQNYDRRRSGDHLYLVAFYACNDRFEFEDPEITEVYCSQRQWVGELPACITLGEYEEGDEEEYEEYEVVEGGGEEHPHVVPPQPAQPIPPSEPMPPVQSVAAEDETKELINEVTAENSIPHEDTPHSTETKDTLEERTPEKPVTDVNIVVEPTRDPYTPRLLDHECGSENGGCEHKCERLLFPGENEPRLKCSCFEGFSLDPYDYARCHDIDECLANNGGCEQICNNLPGSFECACEAGLQIDTLTGHTCVDINECLLRNGHGPCQDTCHNLRPGYRCSCDGLAGTQLARDNHSCEGAGECAAANGGCSHICLPSSLGRVLCLCPGGHRMSSDGNNCLDINECESPEISQLCPEGCENTVGSFRCIETLNSKEDALEAEAVDERERATEKAAPATCPPGFGVSQGGSCEDIDECATGVSGCDHCRNTEGGFECICPPGFELDEDDRTCIDVNECDIIVEEDVNVGPSKLCAYGCQNTPGSFHCTCAADAHLLDDGRTCVADTCADLSNAALGKTRCAYQCEDLPHGGYACTCPAGYRLGSDARSCELVEDACATKGGYELCAPGTCNSSADNTSYICNCPPGYFAEASACRDIDECSSGTYSCSHVCINSAGGYQCSCPDGYRLSAGSSEKCEDVDECQSQSNLCGNLICLNVPGGFMCVCPDGSEPNAQGRCEAVSADPCAKENGGCSHMCMSESHGATCGCPNGMRLADDGRNCFYEDLCAENNGGCEQLCAQGTCGCRDGFLLREDGKSCRDFDECSISNGDCQQECRNYEGSYECACQAGFRLADDRRTCIDTDECALGSHGCSHDCVNLAGGYECTCPQGYVLGEDKAMCLEVSAAPAECAAGSMLVAGEGCVPLSSCLSNNGGCSHTCDDVLGCTCPVGLELAVDDKTCVDVDECLLNNGGCSSICVNTFGSYQCACRDGATLTDGRSCPAVCPLGFRNSPVDATVCEDIDECATPGTCQFGCLNLNGSYTCICPPGYALRDGRECEDIDECLSDNGGCRNGGECVNLEGSYVCRCPADSILGADRHTCEPRDKCSELAAPPNGDVHCTKYRHKTELFYNTKCKVWCNRGYRLQGPTHRYCDANGIWDTQENECTPIVCPRIPQPSNGVIVPATCSSGKTFLGERCRLRCHPGHVPIGKTVAVCTASQLWSTNTTLDCVRTRDSSPWHTTAATANRRLSPPPALPEPPSILPASHNRKPLLPPDFATTLTHLPPVATTTPAPTQPPLGLQPTDIGIRRPYIKCPRNTTVFLSSGEPTAHIILQRPVTNLDFRYIESQPAWARDLQAHLGPGSYVITFRGHDPATGRSARCQTVINVRRAEAPRVEFCPESFEVTLRENQAYRSVFWKEPRFEGDLGRRLKKMYKSRIPGELFGAGVHTIYYEATNEEGLTARCEFQITVKAPAKTPVVGYGFLPSSAQTTHGFSPATQTAHGFHAGVQTSRGFSQSSQTSHGFSQSSQTSHGFKLVETSRGFNQASHTSHGFDHASRTTHTLQPYANYAESYTVPRESARLLPGHESYIFCPGQAAIRVADEQPVNLPADCTLKNVRVHPSRHHLQGRTLSSLWKPFTKF